MDLTPREKVLARLAHSLETPPGVSFDSSDSFFTVRIDTVYPVLLNSLRLDDVTGEPKPVAKNQYWMNVCRRIVAKYLFDLMKRPVQIRLTAENKEEWNYKNFPEGYGAQRGADEFHSYYQRGKFLLDKATKEAAYGDGPQ